MSALDTHRVALQWATELIELTMQDVTDEHAHWHPPGKANPIAATYAHAVGALDGVITLLQGKQPLHVTSWKGKTGISDPQWQSTADWAGSVRVDLSVARQYAQAVYEKASHFMQALSESDLENEIDLSGVGLGVRTLDWCLSALATGHVNNMAGEISVLKGLQGLQGYPF